MRVAQFGPFELNLEGGELRKNGFKVRLQPKSFLLLRVLLLHAGSVVTREQLKESLWPKDTYVEFETGLNVTVRRLRESLGDSAQAPLYIETIPKLGYRFKAPARIGGMATEGEKAADPREASPPVVPEVAAGHSQGRFGWARLAGVGLILSLLVWISARAHSRVAAAQPSISVAIRSIAMPEARAEQAAVPLADGRVLLLGGRGAGYLASTAFFDPRSGMFSPGPTMQQARDANAVRLRDGRVLIVGGYGGGIDDLKSTEIFEPRTGHFESASAMTYERSGHSVTLLPDGSVIVMGGAQLQDPDGRWDPKDLQTTEIYDPASRQFRPGPDMLQGRQDHTATVMPISGRVLIAGGGDSRHSLNERPALAEAEIYDPKTNTIRRTANMVERRLQHEATVLQNGQVLLTGGYDIARAMQPESDGAEIFDPESETFRPVGKMHVARCRHTATLLKDGRVLIVGGWQGKLPDAPFTRSAQSLDVIEIFDPASETFSLAGHLHVPRAQHTATLLDDGSVLIAGGSNGLVPQDSAEVIRVNADTATASLVTLDDTRRLPHARH